MNIFKRKARRNNSCKIHESEEENTMVWHDEAVVGKVLYPYRIIFKTIFLLDEDKWESEKITVKDLRISVQAGINPVKDEDILKSY